MNNLISRYEALLLFNNNDLATIVLNNDRYNNCNGSYWRIDGTNHLYDSEEMYKMLETSMKSYLYNKNDSCLYCS